MMKDYEKTGQKAELAGILEKQLSLQKEAKVKDKLHKRLGALYVELKEIKKSILS